MTLFAPGTHGAPFLEVDQLRTDAVEKRLRSLLTRSFLLTLLLAVVPSAAFGQDTLALASGTAVPGAASP